MCFHDAITVFLLKFRHLQFFSTPVPKLNKQPLISARRFQFILKFNLLLKCTYSTRKPCKYCEHDAFCMRASQQRIMTCNSSLVQSSNLQLQAGDAVEMARSWFPLGEHIMMKKKLRNSMRIWAPSTPKDLKLRGEGGLFIQKTNLQKITVFSSSNQLGYPVMMSKDLHYNY